MSLKPFFENLECATGLKVHPVVLSRSEELQAQFMETEKAMPFESFCKIFAKKTGGSTK